METFLLFSFSFEKGSNKSPLIETTRLIMNNNQLDCSQ